jgi:hypothetical protein
MRVSKTAVKVVRSVELFCPYCEESIPSATGPESFFWTVEEIQLAESGPVTCPSCSKQVRLPRIK